MFTTASDRKSGSGEGWNEFQGYRRADGRVGVRNHVIVLSTVSLTNRLAELVAEWVPDALPITGEFPRGLRGGDDVEQARILNQLVRHPNVGGALVLCHDKASRAHLLAKLAETGKPVAVQALMAASGMGDAVVKGREALQAIKAEADRQTRTTVPLGSLTVALECGGSDATSALAANPAIGRFVDRLIGAGGTAIVSETAEFVGAEPIIRQRSVDQDTADRILAAMTRTERMLEEDGESYRGVNPTAENIDAGLTTLVEKTMGAIAKTGTCPFAGCLAFAEEPPGPGLHFMDTPFFSPVSITGMVAAGAQLTLFAVGVFNPSGNPLAPTIKVCGNPTTLSQWADSLDVDVSGVITGEGDLPAMGQRVDDAVHVVADGAPSRAESWKEGQIMIPRTHALL